jgi:hypothetical protein
MDDGGPKLDALGGCRALWRDHDFYTEYICKTNKDADLSTRVSFPAERARVKLSVLVQVLVDVFMKRGASGKPSTWFSLGEHVQKDLLSSELLFFATYRVDLCAFLLCC